MTTERVIFVSVVIPVCVPRTVIHVQQELPANAIHFSIIHTEKTESCMWIGV